MSNENRIQESATLMLGRWALGIAGQEQAGAISYATIRTTMEAFKVLLSQKAPEDKTPEAPKLVETPKKGA